LFERAGRTCCQVLPFLFAGLLLSNCTMKDYNFNPYTTIVNQVIKTQYTKEKTNE